MTSKCKCGHEHLIGNDGKRRTYCVMGSQCNKCKKFQPEDDPKWYPKLVEEFMKAFKQKKGSSEEKVWKDYLNHVKHPQDLVLEGLRQEQRMKQKKGCGKCEYCVKKRILDMPRMGKTKIPSFSNQSPSEHKVAMKLQKPNVTEDTPEEPKGETSVKPSGTQSPSDKPRNGRSERISSGESASSNKTEDTSTLSDEIEEVGDGRLMIYHSHVQEFIRRLKEAGSGGFGSTNTYLLTDEDFVDLAGSKLVKGGKENE